MSLHKPPVNDGSLMQKETSNASDYTVDSTPTFIETPEIGFTPDSSVQQRPGYRRVASLGEQDTTYHSPEHWPQSSEGSCGNGLGINNLQRLSSALPGGGSPPATPGSSNPLLSPQAAHSQRAYRPPDHDPMSVGNKAWMDDASSTDPFQPFIANSETETLQKQTTTPTGLSFEPSGPECRAKKKLHHGKGNKGAVTVTVLSVYSTVLSGVWLGVALAKPRFGHMIHSNSIMTPATASLIAAGLAKTIELSFVTVFVAFLGQVLSRRALVGRSRGITISEMSMRQWIMQPGTMITHWNTVRYAALTFLGLISLLGALTAMFYTTASDALVAPQLKVGDFEDRVLYGKVAASFANEPYIEKNCKTPIPETSDTFGPSTCIGIEHAGQAYHNYMQYISNWTNNIAMGAGSDSLSQRPIPLAMLYDNTTVQGRWIHIDNMSNTSLQYSSDKYKRTVTNVTIAMPHAGIFAATRDPINQILQPQDLDGLGEYEVHASVPSPTTNVLCASMQKEELVPMVFSEWPAANATNLTGWPTSVGVPTWPSWLNETSVDDLFSFGEKYSRRSPVFSKLPLPFNTVANFSGWYADSIYILATSATDEYTMCSLKTSLTAECSTRYHASLSGGSLNAHCEDQQDGLAYRNSHSNATDSVVLTDWATVASEWVKATSLNNGISDGNASIARLLSQLIPTNQALDKSLPSIAEALAVLSGSTLLLSSTDAPFIHFWNYSAPNNILAEPQYQAFQAAVRSREYASGGTKSWQNIFYSILGLTFAINIFCFIYFLIRHGLVTDYIEPQNLFALSLNSPPSHALDGACGGGPEAKQLTTDWHIKMDREREHFYIQSGQGTPEGTRRREQSRDFEMDPSPVIQTYTKLSSKKSSYL